MEYVTSSRLTRTSGSAPEESRVTQGTVAHRPHGWHRAFVSHDTFGCVATISRCATIIRYATIIVETLVCHLEQFAVEQ